MYLKVANCPTNFFTREIHIVSTITLQIFGREVADIAGTISG
jgi:hypothetical protein